MLWSILWSVATHHGEPADPDLIEWIKARLDHIFGVGPWVVVAALALLILLVPLLAMAVYLVQQRGQSGADPTAQEHEES